MTGKEARQRLDILIKEIEAQKIELEKNMAIARQSSEQLLVIINEANGKLSAITSVENNVTQKAQTAEQFLSVITEKKGRVEKEAESIIITRADAEKKKVEIEQLATETMKLLETNNEQTEKINELLQKAAAGSLFKSFDIRKKEHGESAKFWAWMLGLSAVALFAVAWWFVWVVHAKGELSYEFLIKLSVSFPIIFWLAFSSSQYSKAKRLEEEYAFKSAISLSLEAYRDLIKKESNESTKAEVIPFITGAVSQIFSSPTITIADHPDKEDNIEMGVLEKVTEMLKKFIK